MQICLIINPEGSCRFFPAKNLTVFKTFYPRKARDQAKRFLRHPSKLIISLVEGCGDQAQKACAIPLRIIRQRRTGRARGLARIIRFSQLEATAGALFLNLGQINFS